MPSLGDLAAPWNKNDDIFKFSGDEGFEENYDKDKEPAANGGCDQGKNHFAEHSIYEANVTGPRELSIEMCVIDDQEVNIEKSFFLSNVSNMPRSIVY